MGKVNTDDRPHRIKSLEGLERLRPFLRLNEIAKKLGVTKQTFYYRLNHGTDLTQNERLRAFATDATELLEEIYYELGVMLEERGRNPHKKYKYLAVKDPGERYEDPIEFEEH